MIQILILSFFFASSFTQAAELKLFSIDFPPYTYQTPNGGAGVMYEVVQELAKRVGQTTQVEFMPWARARLETEKISNGGVFPLARTTEREKNYSWVAHILDDPYVFFAMKSSKVNISSIAAAKKIRVGTLKGSVAELELKKLGFSQTESVAHDVQNVKKLKQGRIDVWVAPLSSKNQYKEKADLSADELKTGAELLILHEYLGASKSLDAQTLQKWQKAFTSMKEDGSYAAIMKKYGFTPLK